MLFLIGDVVIVVSMLGVYAAHREGLGALFGRQVACSADRHVTANSRDDSTARRLEA